MKNNRALPEATGAHEGLEPFDIKIPLRGALHIGDEFSHFLQSNDVDREDDNVTKQRRGIYCGDCNHEAENISRD